ncbi:MAG: hydroxymethylglutaryl-CoA lyase [Acidobacteriota bacterium]
MTGSLPHRVSVVDVGPRDGLQHEATLLDVAAKVTFIELIASAGVPVVEAGAFVSPRWVPQMADTDEVFARVSRREGTRYPALVPNIQGLERASAAGVNEVAIFAAASESFSRKNINQSIAESLETYAAVCARAHESGFRVRGYVSTGFGCPFEGAVPPARVAEIAGALADMGVFEVSISDTIGVAHPGQVWNVLEALGRRLPVGRTALHFHDTRGTGLANVLAGLQAGVSVFDTSCGGLGGCPYAPGSTGNLATEDLVYMLSGLGVETSIDLNALVAASDFMAGLLDHPLPSRYYQASRRGQRPDPGRELPHA